MKWRILACLVVGVFVLTFAYSPFKALAGVSLICSIGGIIIGQSLLKVEEAELRLAQAGADYENPGFLFITVVVLSAFGAFAAGLLVAWKSELNLVLSILLGAFNFVVLIAMTFVWCRVLEEREARRSSKTRAIVPH